MDDVEAPVALHDHFAGDACLFAQLKQPRLRENLRTSTWDLATIDVMREVRVDRHFVNIGRS